MRYLEDNLFTLPKRTKIAIMIFKLGLILSMAVCSNLLYKQNTKIKNRIIQKEQEEKEIQEQIRKSFLIKKLKIKDNV